MVKKIIKKQKGKESERNRVRKRKGKEREKAIGSEGGDRYDKRTRGFNEQIKRR